VNERPWKTPKEVCILLVAFRSETHRLADLHGIYSSPLLVAHAARCWVITKQMDAGGRQDFCHKALGSDEGVRHFYSPATVSKHGGGTFWAWRRGNLFTDAIPLGPHCVPDILIELDVVAGRDQVQDSQDETFTYTSAMNIRFHFNLIVPENGAGWTKQRLGRLPHCGEVLYTAERVTRDVPALCQPTE